MMNIPSQFKRGNLRNTAAVAIVSGVLSLLTAQQAIAGDAGNCYHSIADSAHTGYGQQHSGASYHQLANTKTRASHRYTVVQSPWSQSAQIQKKHDLNQIQRIENNLNLTHQHRVKIQAGLAYSLNRHLAFDGIFGKNTRKAIAQWQQQSGLKPTGYLNLSSARMLLRNAHKAMVYVDAKQHYRSEDKLVAVGWNTGYPRSSTVVAKY